MFPATLVSFAKELPMPPIRIALCTYSHGLGNGIAHMDAALAAGLDRTRFTLETYVLRTDLPDETALRENGAVHIGLAGAYPFLCSVFRDIDIVHVNGALDPVVCNAAAASGVPAVIEVMHQTETGGLHPALDAVVCVSGLVRSVQTHPNAVVIENGIDTDWFSFLPGAREPGAVNVIQVANASKQLQWELGEVLSDGGFPEVKARMVGSRPANHGLLSMGNITDMPSVYHGADLLFLLESHGAFGLVFAEAMACGTLPVISGASGALAFIHPGETGWVVASGSRREAANVLRQAVDTVHTPWFIHMQHRARAVIVAKYSRQRMLADYEKLYAHYGKRPRKPAREPAAWMDLALFAVLFRQGVASAYKALDRFIAGTLPLEPSFLRHPMGQAVVAAVLQACPQLWAIGHTGQVRALCARLRASRVVSPLLDAAETLNADA